MIPSEATKEYAQGRFGVWPEDADADGALRETARALDNVVSVWIDVRTHYRRTMLDLTQTPFCAAKAAAKYIDSKTTQALSQLDKATDSVKRELSELEKKHAPKLGNFAETMMESEVRAFLRSLPEYQLAGKLGEAAMMGDIVTLRAALFAPPILLLPIAESVRETVAEGFARATDPEGFNRRGLLAKALAAIQKSGTALIVETNKLIPPHIAKAGAHDVNAAKQAERLVDAERVRSQVDLGEPVIFSGKGAGLYSAPLPDLPSLRPASRKSEPVEEPGVDV